MKRLATALAASLALVHGSLVCANARATERGVVLTEWSGAYLGCTLLDVVRLTADLVERDDAVRGIGLSRHYGAAIGRAIGTDELRAAELIERAVRRLGDGRATRMDEPSRSDGRGDEGR